MPRRSSPSIIGAAAMPEPPCSLCSFLLAAGGLRKDTPGRLRAPLGLRRAPRHRVPERQSRPRMLRRPSSALPPRIFGSIRKLEGKNRSKAGQWPQRALTEQPRVPNSTVLPETFHLGAKVFDEPRRERGAREGGKDSFPKALLLFIQFGTV